MFQRTLTTELLFPPPREPLLLSADWPRGNLLEAARDACNHQATTGAYYVCNETLPLFHRTEHNGTRWWGGHGLLGEDEMGRRGNRHAGCLRPWTPPHDNAFAGHNPHDIDTPTCHRSLALRHDTSQPPPYDVDRWAWPWLGVAPKTDTWQPSPQHRQSAVAGTYTGPSCIHPLLKVGNCQPPPAHGRSGESKRRYQANSVAELAWMSHNDPSQQPAVVLVPDNTGIPRATSEQHSHSVGTNTYTATLRHLE